MTTWRYIEEDGVGAARGLATDEYLMEDCSEGPRPAAPPALRLYTYRNHCALVGRFQNIHAELDLDACNQERVDFSRRLTGGGAILMGAGQLGVCLAIPDAMGAGNTRELYHLLSTPILMALKNLGIDAGFRGKNDLEADGRKIAGLGIHVNPQGAAHFHASLLVDLDIPLMLRVLRIPLQKIGDKPNIAKVEQRIATVSGLLNRPVSTAEVRQRIKICFAEHFGVRLEAQPLRPGEQALIDRLAAEKYRHDDWIFQRSPQPDMTGMGLRKTPAGLLRAYVALKGETIKSALITGDFMDLEPLFQHIEAQLKWSPLDQQNIAKVVENAFETMRPLDPGLSPLDVQQALWRAALGAMKEAQYTYNGSCYYPNATT